MRILAFSSFTFSYLDRARVLFQSIKRYHPDWHCVALVTDRAPTGVNPLRDEPFDELVYSDGLLENFRSWIFKHDLVEACTAVKGPYLLASMNRGFDSIVYLDPDTCLFGPLESVCHSLKKSNISLTPHQLMPDQEMSAIVDNEITSLKTGVYNLGFLAVKCSAEGLRFAQWWNDRLLNFCFDDVARGLFVDQRWCDHVPAMFSGVSILRDPGLNVASWNLSNRKIEIVPNGGIEVNGTPLRFWHFTKLGALADTMTRRYAKDNFSVYEIWNWYKEQVNSSKASDIPMGYWKYGRFDDGQQIKKSARILYRERTDLQLAFPNPFLSGPATYQEWLQNAGA